MARLAAYYQEDFHYAPVGGTRKAYVLYDRPAPRTAVATLRAPRPHHRQRLADPSRRAAQRLEGAYETPECINPYAVARYEADAFDRRSDTLVKGGYDDACRGGPYDGQADPYDEYAGGGPADWCRCPEDCLPPPVSFRSDSSHGRWQQWPWNAASPDGRLSALDSGLSSATASTSPTSLEAESGHVCCSCPRVAAYDVASPRYDSGRSSPGLHPASPGRRRPAPAARYYDDDEDDPVRYGMLGIVGEPPAAYDCPPPVPQATHYYYIEEDEVPLSPPRDRPAVVITEASDHSAPSDETTPEPVAASDGGGEDRRRRTERDIRELEDMYRKCSLDWHDLLERADRRETVHQTRTDQTARPLARSKSDTLCESGRNPYANRPRAPPLRRSGVPDIVADDMALRKHSRPAAARPFDPADRPVTYMLCSSHFTPSVRTDASDLPLLLPGDPDRPDVEHDDWSYRKHYVGRGGPDAPQPPFGIPLRPPPPRPSDYLRHAVPSSVGRPLCHPRGHPDVVRDDLAYRALRKDEPDSRLYYEVPDAAWSRKKRA